MSNCGCAMQAPQCEQGKLIFANLRASYQFLTSQEFLHLPESSKERLHTQYESERQQYFHHIGEPILHERKEPHEEMLYG